MLLFSARVFWSRTRTKIQMDPRDPEDPESQKYLYSMAGKRRGSESNAYEPTSFDCVVVGRVT
jgi:hypothetical protein